MEETRNQNGKKGKRFAINTLKGVTLGISAAIAGLSAGTIAVAESCYDTLVDAISSLRKSFKKSFMILLPFILGAVIGAVAALVGIQRGYKAAPFSITGFFAGLVFGSLPVTFSELKHGKDRKEIAAHCLAFIISLLIAAGLGIVTALTSFSLESYLDNRVWWMYILVLVAGFLAAAACVVPGISGSMTLMVIGMYYPILNTFTGDKAIWHSGSGTVIGTGLVLLLLLAIGAVAGLIVSSKVMKVLLDKHHVTTYYSILGLILGSLISMFVNSSIYPLYPTIKTWDYLAGSVLFILGALAVFLLIRYTSRKNRPNE